MTQECLDVKIIYYQESAITGKPGGGFGLLYLSAPTTRASRARRIWSRLSSS